MARSFKLTTALEIAVLAVFAVVMLFPVLWMLETAFKDTKDIYAVPAKVFTSSRRSSTSRTSSARTRRSPRASATR